jgi:DNA-binding MarR family transcriptional regulator
LAQPLALCNQTPTIQHLKPTTMATFYKRPTTHTMHSNANQLQVLAYWAQKYGMSPADFKKLFEANGSSLSATIHKLNKA